MKHIFTVTQVVDGDTFKVRPMWGSCSAAGDTVRPTGYDTPERGDKGYAEATQKLTRLILGKQVQLGEAVNFDHGRIVCPVYFDGKDLAEYFPEYKC